MSVQEYNGKVALSMFMAKGGGRNGQQPVARRESLQQTVYT